MFRKADDTTVSDAACKRQRLMQSGLDDAQSSDAAALQDDPLADTSYVAYSLKPHGSSHEALLAEASEFVDEALDGFTTFTSKPGSLTLEFTLTFLLTKKISLLTFNYVWCS
jgi:hypothetical protein